jgi:hypothetical protein
MQTPRAQRLGFANFSGSKPAEFAGPQQAVPGRRFHRRWQTVLTI